MDSIQTIGESIRFLRQQNGLSQEQLALVIHFFFGIHINAPYLRFQLD
ncbi:hypothetical protein [Saccharibacillus brassicae]|nr:hypothetical protein [Saccharibacillus brassicae]